MLPHIFKKDNSHTAQKKNCKLLGLQFFSYCCRSYLDRWAVHRLNVLHPYHEAGYLICGIGQGAEAGGQIGKLYAVDIALAAVLNQVVLENRDTSGVHRI
ncbi:hypothetical protein D3C73_1506060 [compost metagenome]